MADAVPTVRMHKLGLELQRLRLAARFTLEGAGRVINRSKSTVGRIEQGLRPLDQDELTYILDAYGVRDSGLREHLSRLASGRDIKSWWSRMGDLSPEFEDRISLEQDTAAFRVFAAVAIPGLLQTPEYARAMMRSLPSEEPADLAWTVNFRMARQRVISGARPARLSVVMWAAVLEHVLGSRDVARRQLRYLLEMARRENVSLQVLPFDAGSPPGAAGSFQIWELRSCALTLVTADSLTRNSFIEQDDEVQRYNLAFEHLRSVALPEPESLMLIAERAAAL